MNRFIKVMIIFCIAFNAILAQDSIASLQTQIASELLVKKQIKANKSDTSIYSTHKEYKKAIEKVDKKLLKLYARLNPLCSAVPASSAQVVPVVTMVQPYPVNGGVCTLTAGQTLAGMTITFSGAKTQSYTFTADDLKAINEAFANDKTLYVNVLTDVLTQNKAQVLIVGATTRNVIVNEVFTSGIPVSMNSNWSLYYYYSTPNAPTSQWILQSNNAQSVTQAASIVMNS